MLLALSVLAYSRSYSPEALSDRDRFGIAINGTNRWPSPVMSKGVLHPTRERWTLHETRGYHWDCYWVQLDRERLGDTISQFTNASQQQQQLAIGFNPLETH